MSGKGSISRMSDECLMKQETAFSFYTQYQAVMRKFKLAGKSYHFPAYVSHHIDLQVIRLTFSSLLPAFFY